jgi:hypothetical protein
VLILFLTLSFFLQSLKHGKTTTAQHLQRHSCSSANFALLRTYFISNITATALVHHRSHLHVISIPLFDWQTLAGIQAAACLAISAFVNLALLQNPEKYGLHLDGDTPSCPPLATSQDDPRTEKEGVELQTKSSSVAEGESAGFVGEEQQSSVRRRSGEHADAVSTAAQTQESHAAGSDASAPQELEGLTVREALRRPIFWLIVLSIFFIDVLWGGFNLHFVSVLEDQGLGRTSGASTFMATSIAAAISSLLCGPFFDRMPLGMKVRMRAQFSAIFSRHFQSHVGLILRCTASGYSRCYWLWCFNFGKNRINLSAYVFFIKRRRRQASILSLHRATRGLLGCFTAYLTLFPLLELVLR